MAPSRGVPDERIESEDLPRSADDPLARQRFLYWAWMFDAFLEEANDTLERGATAK